MLGTINRNQITTTKNRDDGAFDLDDNPMASGGGAGDALSSARPWPSAPTTSTAAPAPRRGRVRAAAGGRHCGGGHHDAGVGLGGEEESCLRSALWIHTEICSFKSENKISKLVPS